MKKATKFLLGGALVILFLTPVSQVKADWHQDNVGWWYSLNDGSYFKDTVAQIDGKNYKFDNRGYMITGWQYNVSDDGDYHGWYYYDPVNGDEKRGWQLIDGKWYYLSAFGARFGGQNIDGKQYYFDPVNRDLKTGWLDLNGTRYYADPNDGGAFAMNKTLIIDGVSYTFSSGGSVINNEP